MRGTLGGNRWAALALWSALLGNGAAGASEQEPVDVLGAVGLSAAALGATWVTRDSDGAYQFFLSFGATQVVLKAMTRAIEHEGPNGDGNSFPSDHATAAFSGAAFLHRHYGWRAAVPAYTLAAATSANRVRHGHHDWADVTAGAALAIGVNYLMHAHQGHFTVAPTTHGGGMLVFATRF